MPSVSAKQATLMKAVAHGWKPDRVQVPLSVAMEFHQADRRKKKGNLEKIQYRGKERRHG
jgi:hypothetical protein